MPDTQTLPTDRLATHAAGVIAAFDAQGWHRTGTDVDRHSGEWLAEQVTAIGLTARLEPFNLIRIQPVTCYVQVGGARIPGLPAFDGHFTVAGGIKGRLGPLNSDAPVVLLEAPPQAGNPAAAVYEHTRDDRQHAAIIVITTGPQLGLAPRNAESARRPFGVPVLQVSSEHADILRKAMHRGDTVTFVSRVDQVEAVATNVTATIPGRNPDLPPLVVMTPRSGWWECASERGGGLVCWLESLRALHEAGPDRTVHAVASSGHELGHMGLDAFLDARPALATDALAWIHYGANIGAASPLSTRLFATDDELEQVALQVFRDGATREVTPMPRAAVPSGESRNIHERGGRYISLIAGNDRFHLQTDRWPDAVDVPAVVAFARATAALCVRLASATPGV